MNQFEYAGKLKKINEPWASNLEDMNKEDKIRLDKQNVKDLITRETVFAAAYVPFGVPGLVAGTALGFIDSEIVRKKKQKEYNEDQQDLGAAVNEAMNEL